MQSILDFAKTLLLAHCNTPGVCVDFTMGNGWDTLFLAQHCPESNLFAFDIQESALAQTKALLSEHGLSDRTTLILDSHANFKQYINEPLQIGVFNFGYLPHGDKHITTRLESSLPAVQQAVEALSPTGILVLVLYPGHPEGARESEALQSFCAALPSGKYDVVQYAFLNKKTPPYLLAITHRQQEG